jgi:glycosyltransferase involved in cell wall biosynthesis
MTPRALRLLSVGHSYVVALNRRLPNEIARVSGGRWEVTVAAPKLVRTDVRKILLERDGREASRLEPFNAYATRYLHVMMFGTRLREIFAEGWDMVHIFQDPYIVPGWQAAHWTPSGTPFVFFTAQNLRKSYPPPFSWMERYCLDRCTGWIGCGDTVIHALLKKGYGAKPYRRIGFGVDIEEFRSDDERRHRVREKLGWGDSVPVVCFLGRLVEQKGLELLMRVLDKVRAPWRALFIGGGPMQKQVEEWAKNYPDKARIVSVSHGEVPAYLNAADILCAPSQTMKDAREQFGRMIIEGFASGLAVVGSDSGEIPSVIGDAGVVAGEKDEAAWVRALERLLEDRAWREELAKRGRERAVEKFAWPVIARQHIEFFEELLDRRSAGVAAVKPETQVR